MKKYVWLAVVTVLAIGAVFGVGEWLKPKPFTVSVVTLEEKTVQQTVKCNGKVEASDSQEVYVEAPCVAGTVFVKEGQKVKKGQPLFSVDTQATQAVLSQLSGGVTDGVELPMAKEVVSPIDGVAAAVNVRKGETVDYTAPCAVITTGNARQIAVAIREQYLPQVKVGQSATVWGVAFSKTYHGTVKSIASTARQQYVGTLSETVVDAVVSLEESAADLRVGLNAQAGIVVSTTENALLLPYETIGQDENGKEFVYVFDGKQNAYRRAVELGRETADGVLVVSGVSAGERVVQNPEELFGEQISVRVA